MIELPRFRAQDRAQGRSPDEGASDRGEAAARGLPATIREAELWADQARPRTGIRELDQELHRVVPRLGVRVRQDDVRSARRSDSLVRVRGEAEILVVDDQGGVGVGRGRVRDHDKLVDLRPERVEAAFELRIGPVRDDDGIDAPAQRSSR
jgi:hypothetical protein